MTTAGNRTMLRRVLKWTGICLVVALIAAIGWLVIQDMTPAEEPIGGGSFSYHAISVGNFRIYIWPPSM